VKQNLVLEANIAESENNMEQNGYSLCGDLRSAIQYYQQGKVDVNNKYNNKIGHGVFYSFNSTTFFIKLQRVNSINGKPCKDHTVVINTEAVQIYGRDDEGSIISQYGKLRGYVVHLGTSPNSGHYVTYCRQTPQSTEWMLYNDATVYKNVKEGEEMSGLAYILLYDVCSQNDYDATMQLARDHRLKLIQQRAIAAAMVAAYYNPTDEEMLKSVIFKTFQHTCYKSFPHLFHGNKTLNEVGNTFINDLLMNQLRIKKLSIKGLIEQGYKIWIDELFQTLCDVKLANSTIYNDFMVQLCSTVESRLKKSLKPFITGAFCDENMNRLTSEICAQLQQKLLIVVPNDSWVIESGFMETVCDSCKLIMCGSTCQNCSADNE
jgi:hypothetical protein